MTKYNRDFANHFGSRMILARARDNHRDRDVTLHLISDDHSVVGVTDGTDAWIAPVVGRPFDVDVVRILEDLRKGKMPELQNSPKHRRRAVLSSSQSAEEPRRPRRTLA